MTAKARRTRVKRIGTRWALTNLVDLALGTRDDWMLNPADAGATNALKARSGYLVQEMPPRQLASLVAQLALTVAVFADRLPEEQRKALLDSIRRVPESPLT